MRARLVLGILAVALSTSATSAPVPAQYRSLYDQLQANVRAIKPGRRPKKPVTQFGGELRVANSNAGPALLRPGIMTRVGQQLDSFQKLKIPSVRISVNYPILDPTFPDQPRYVDFYRQVADEISKRGMTLSVETNDLLVGTPYTSVPWDYSGLTFDTYAAAKGDRGKLVIQTMHPRYLSLETESDTASRVTGLGLDDPAAYAAAVSAMIDRLGPHAGTLVGAGPGSWTSPDFDGALAKIPSLDYIDVHLYSTASQPLANVHTDAQIAHSAKKQGVMTEAWLYKGTQENPLETGGAASL